jgi:stress response protein SCP2
MGEGQGQKKISGDLKETNALAPERRSKIFFTATTSAQTALQQFSQRNIAVVERTTEVLKCDFRTDRHTSESIFA